LLLLLASATPAFAQEGGLLDINEGLMVWTILIFLVVLGILYKAAFPHILGAVEAREARIRELLEQAERDREAAKAALADQQAQLEATRSQVQEYVAEGRAAGERVRDEIISDARRQADDLLVRTRNDLRQEFERAVDELRVEAIDIALAAASKLVQRNLNEEDNRRLVREYLADLETSSAAARV
jgi:F-type H+-transporting ATPase subunit b